MPKDNSVHAPSPYRWVILLLVGFSSMIGGFSQYQMSALAFRIIPQFELSTVQFSSLVTAPMLLAVFASLPAGALGDRFGVKKVVSVGAVISVMGNFYRVIADSYWELFISMVLLTLCMTLINANFAKYLGLWFPKKQLGVAVGIYYLLCMSGATISLALTAALFDSVYDAFLTPAVIMLVLTVLWIVLAKNKPPGAEDLPVMPVLKYVRVAAKSRNVWITGLATAFAMGSMVTMMTYLPTAFTTVKGIDPSEAGFLTSLFTFGTLVGSLVLTVLCDKLGVMKAFIIVITLGGTAALYLSWILPEGVIVWILLVIAGFLAGSSMPILFTIPIRLKEIGPVYAGSAGGIVSTIQMLGGFFLPTFVIGKIAGNNYNLLFNLGCLSFLFIVVFTLFLPELGWRKQAGMEKDRQDR
ncbi:MAG: NarK/NasA family nitrate transporter [Peptococcaceae bacterium]|nr:NarK/NasA family nitrate transporter [Peptococcaceae bacterium]